MVEGAMVFDDDTCRYSQNCLVYPSLVLCSEAKRAILSCFKRGQSKDTYVSELHVSHARVKLRPVSALAFHGLGISWSWRLSRNLETGDNKLFMDYCVVVLLFS